jgi:hypothetical protein
MNFDIEKLRPKLDLEGKYVDFSVIRTGVSVLSFVETIEVKINEPNAEGECRADCPKCEKPRSFSLNINTNRFNCFNKGCDLKGGGVIDFTSKLFDTTAKEASHLLACAYGIQPYTADDSGAGEAETNGAADQSREVVTVSETDTPLNGDYIRRDEHDELRERFDRLSNIVFGFMLEHDENCHQPREDGIYEHHVSH